MQTLKKLLRGGVVVVCWSVIALSAVALYTVVTAPKSKDSGSTDFVWLRHNQRLVAEKLKDPSSAQFSDNDYVSRKSGGPVACGTVNARNSFGGYTGPQHYISAGSLGILFVTDKGFRDLWKRVC